MKTIHKLSLVALLLSGLLVLSACTAESESTPTTADTTTAPTPTVTTVTTTSPDNPDVTTTPQVTNESAPATNEPAKCEHDYIVSDGEPSCTGNVTIYYTCTQCGDSYQESVKALGHNYVNGTCTNCRIVNLLTLSGDEIVDLIKADGCPEDKLIYGFDTEVDADELAKIEKFMYSDAAGIFTIFAPTFYDPTEVSLYGILYESTGYTKVTKEECTAYYEYYDMSPEMQNIFSPHKLTTAEIEDYLMTYLGIPFTDEM